MSTPIDPQLIGILRNADMNTVADQPIAITYSPGTKYRIFFVMVCNPSVPLVTAIGGVYTGLWKTGAAVVSPLQAYATLILPGSYVDATLASSALQLTFNAPTLYLSLTIPEGTPATADFYIYGIPVL